MPSCSPSSWSTARRLRLVGWVRNLPDADTVEVVAEGPRTSLEKLLAHLHHGPPKRT
ncbi:acylphosphatase [Chloroflexota bacterium]